jgi:transcriptional regulator with GAF, ATPase, and Fis domain
MQNKIDIIGQSQSIKKIFDLIDKVADSDSTVLICGESGTGKEVVAKRIHFQSLRADKPFIPINCGAIPEALLESELFGHEKGAFTGAITTRLGRFELAHGGTLFFDEIGEMPYPLQVKLLRAIQEREFERIGGSKSIQVNVRILAATNIDLEAAVLAKQFRKDLFYRLNVIPMTLPSLNNRKEDIPLLITHFLEKCNQKKQTAITGISDDALRLLVAYSWPGNIRELENIVERIVVLKGEGMVSPEDLPEKITASQTEMMIPLREELQLEALSATVTSPQVEPTGGDLPTEITAPPIGDRMPLLPMTDICFEIPDEGISLPKLVEAFENRMIEQALKKTDGVKSRAAFLLGLNRTTLVEKLKRRGERVFVAPVC